jgi:hypothetical protein
MRGGFVLEVVEAPQGARFDATAHSLEALLPPGAAAALAAPGEPGEEE